MFMFSRVVQIVKLDARSIRCFIKASKLMAKGGNDAGVICWNVEKWYGQLEKKRTLKKV